jgi:peptidyl-prolyl cis-trans isomerase A (cyclophilin A)
MCLRFRPISRYPLLTLLLMLVQIPTSTRLIAGPIVEVETSMGVFFLELDELSTPETTENFIKYVAAGRYDNTFVYGTTNASFLRGGGYTFNTCPLSVGRIEPISSVLPERTMLSNSGGVISMMMRNKATDVITSDWTISISDNRSYDGSDYGYIPFGRVLGYGMEVVETIAFRNSALGPEILGGPEDDFFDETINCATPMQDNHISIKMTLLNDDPTAPAAFYSTSDNTLTVNVIVEGKFFKVPFVIENHGNNIAITPRLDDIVEMEKPVPNMAMFDTIERIVSIGTLAVDGVVLYEDLIFSWHKSSPQRFFLESYIKI